MNNNQKQNPIATVSTPSNKEDTIETHLGEVIDTIFDPIDTVEHLLVLRVSLLLHVFELLCGLLGRILSLGGIVL